MAQRLRRCLRLVASSPRCRSGGDSSCAGITICDMTFNIAHANSLARISRFLEGPLESGDGRRDRLELALAAPKTSSSLGRKLIAAKPVTGRWPNRERSPPIRAKRGRRWTTLCATAAAAYRAAHRSRYCFRSNRRRSGRNLDGRRPRAAKRHARPAGRFLAVPVIERSQASRLNYPRADDGRPTVRVKG